MKKTSIAILCIFCLVMAGVLSAGGYKSYGEYRAQKTYTEIGQDMLGQNENVINKNLEMIEWVKEKLNFNIGEYFEQLWQRLKKFFKDAFDWIPGVNYDDDNFGTSGNGYGVPEYNGMGGGSGGAR